jgi:hypothetical protein
MLLETLSQNFSRARLVNQTSGSFVAKVPTITEPEGDANSATGSAIIDLSVTNSNPGMFAQNGVIVTPYGVGSDDQTFSIRVIGWRRHQDPTGVAPALWVPVNLLEVQCTLCTVTGAAGAVVDNTQNFVDIITVTTGSTLSGEAAAENIVSPANNTIAHFLVDLKGFQKLEFSFSTGGSVTSCNALVSLL